MLTKTCQTPKIENILMESFSEALQTKDIKKISALLSEEGVYNIQSPRLNNLQVNKKRFVSWIKKRLKQVDEISISYDQCLHCSIGTKVLLLNDGTFPTQIKASYQRSKTALMLEVENDLISRIKFCYVLLKTDNKYVFEIEIENDKKYERIREFFHKEKK